MAKKRNGRVKTDVTLADVVRAIEAMSASLGDRIDSVNASLSDRIDGVNDRVDSLNDRVESLTKEVRALRKDMQKGFQADRVILRKHEQRISKLETRARR